MWHQYGKLPQDNEGVYLQVQGVPKGWKAVVKGTGDKAAARRKQARAIKNLASVVGFSPDPVRLGEMANYGTLEEAIVAVPFYEEDSERKFFTINRLNFDKLLEPGGLEENERTKLMGDSVADMIRKMRKYNFPPSFDFVKNRHIDPFSMYIFEFKENLRKQDLVNIWQNLPPSINSKVKTQEVSITHELLAEQLMGSGLKEIGSQKEYRLNTKVRWMVFKVKKKCRKNYNNKILLKKGTSGNKIADRTVTSTPTGKLNQISYNWPHDHYSLIELCKLEANLEFSEIEQKPDGSRDAKIIKKEDL
jgi:hypothetical protein